MLFMWTDYWIMFGALLLLYGLCRVCLFWEVTSIEGLFRPSNFERSRPHSNWTAKPIDTASLSIRLQRVRQDYGAQLQSRPPTFKRSALTSSKQAEIAQSPFFRKPASPEPPEEEHGLTLLLV
jgi:hypothetical protein